MYNNSSSPYSDAAVWLYSVVPPILLLIGIPGNLISFVIWSRRITSTLGSTSLFLSAMSLTDAYVLLHGCSRQWSIGLSNRQFDLRTFLGCKCPLFLFTFSSDLSTWIIVLLCIERVICTWQPIKFRQICRLRNGSVALALTIIVLAGVNLHFFWTVLVIADSCDPKAEYNEFASYWHYLDFAIYSFVPLALMLILNSTIILRIQMTQKSMKRTGASTDNSVTIRSQHDMKPSANHSRATARSMRILRTVSCMAICHFTLTMPIVLHFLFQDKFCLTTSGDFLSQCDLVEVLVVSLQMTNHMVHFFIYSFTSSVFVADLRRMLDDGCSGYR
ncbi:hypothetical protein CSKR_100651 [Clonorchis sinensis]|uniref:G-protein coupled receptors family 1 profile domain-containing protein n=1 Tax=Clonorchis sinensis TaxID=79923 RepID=A0A419PFT4_CLOSI|nr:hypothetical protein CSKR_100651 [Clonorchis sinensis]